MDDKTQELFDELRQLLALAEQTAEKRDATVRKLAYLRATILGFLAVVAIWVTSQVFSRESTRYTVAVVTVSFMVAIAVASFVEITLVRPLRRQARADQSALYSVSNLLRETYGIVDHRGFSLAQRAEVEVGLSRLDLGYRMHDREVSSWGHREDPDFE